jgi:hypothetical protein
VTPRQLSYWEEVEVNQQIQTLVDLGKMHKECIKIHLQSNFANEEKWKLKILWRLPPTKSSNKAGIFSHAPN